jgi:cytidylate kinase
MARRSAPTSSSEPAAPPVITISASYGAGGSIVGPLLAERLGVPFVDRAIPTTVSTRLDVPLDQALASEGVPHGILSRLISGFAATVQIIPGAPLPPEAFAPSDPSFHAETEQVLLDYAAGGAIILGRAAAVVLREVPHALHVRLDGPHQRRVAQAMRLQKIDRKTAEHELRAADLSREAYVRHWYQVDPRDPRLYHVVLDSTTFGLGTCADIITLASAARSGSAAG